MNARVNAAIMQNFCPVPLQERIEREYKNLEAEAPAGPCDEPTRRRALSKSGPGKTKVSEECAATWSKSEYYDRLSEIKENLSHEEYKMFHEAFRHWQAENKLWKYGGAWQAKVTELSCAIDNTPIECASNFFVEFNAYDQFVSENGVFYNYGTGPLL